MKPCKKQIISGLNKQVILGFLTFKIISKDLKKSLFDLSYPETIDEMGTNADP